MEYCEKGNLKDFLSSRSGGFLDEIELAREPMSADGYLTPTRNAAQQAQVYKVSWHAVFYVRCFFYVFILRRNC